MDLSPIVIDLEASGLCGYSYPISVAWGSKPDAIEYHIIRPEPTWLESGDWDRGAEAIHGFTIETLLEVGEPGFVVATRIAEALQGRGVYSDAPEWDRHWLNVLHSTTGIKRTYEVVDINERIPAFRLCSGAEIEGIRAQAYMECGATPHTAHGDVLMLLTVMKTRGR